MEQAIQLLKDQFDQIKQQGWIKTVRPGNGGVGRTFEHLLNKEEENFEIPDYYGIEIKTKRCYSKSYTCLFSMTPTGKHYHEVKRLRDKYGYPDTIEKKYQVLNNSIYCDKKTSIGIRYYFMLKMHRKEERIYLYIFDIHGQLIENDVYWDFDVIQEKLYRKLKILAFVKASSKFLHKEEYFKYYKMTIYVLKDFETFLSLIEQGIIRITFHISVFRSGKRQGEIHDHGTTFDIQERDLLKLYNLYCRY